MLSYMSVEADREFVIKAVCAGHFLFLPFSKYARHALLSCVAHDMTGCTFEVDELSFCPDFWSGREDMDDTAVLF
jgi:hypothetical protein